MRLRVVELVNRRVKISSMRHCEQMRMRMSSGRSMREVDATVGCCDAFRRVNDNIVAGMIT